jgi:hypothetical protein
LTEVTVRGLDAKTESMATLNQLQLEHRRIGEEQHEQ